MSEPNARLGILLMVLSLFLSSIPEGTFQDAIPWPGKLAERRRTDGLGQDVPHHSWYIRNRRRRFGFDLCPLPIRRQFETQLSPVEWYVIHRSPMDTNG